MADPIDFRTLSLMDALDLAILVEEEAQERYEEFTHQMETHRTPEAAVFFRFMASNEAKHGRQLAARREELFGDAPRRVHRGQLFDVEAPDYDEARAFMAARTAFEVALRCEEKAHEFFVQALPSITDPQVRALFEELREEEVEHQALVKKELAKLPPGPEPSAEDYEDEPVAH
jgi:rubrerythrin